jgi:hypothetical protein
MEPILPYREFIESPQNMRLGESVETTGRRRAFLEGKIQQYTPNINNRSYPREVWEAMLMEDVQDPNSFPSRLGRGEIVGGLGHPKDMIFEPTQIAVVLREQVLQEDGVYGRHEILGTPVGNVVRTLYESGVNLGVSSRGRGPHKEEGTSIIVTAPFFLEGYDVVVEPSVRTARPMYRLQESVEKDPVHNYYSLVMGRLADPNILMEEVQLYDKYRQHLYGERSSGKFFEELTKALMDRTGQPIRTKTVIEVPNQQANPNMEKDPNRLQEQVTHLTTETSRLQEENNRLKTAEQTRLQEATNTELTSLREQVQKLTQRNTKLEEDGAAVARDLEIAKDVIDDVVKELDASKSTITEQAAQLEAAGKLYEQQQARLNESTGKTLGGRAKMLVAKFPEGARPTAAKMLEKANSFEEQNELFESLSHLMKGAGIKDPTLPNRHQEEIAADGSVIPGKDEEGESGKIPAPEGTVKSEARKRSLHESRAGLNPLTRRMLEANDLRAH